MRSIEVDGGKIVSEVQGVDMTWAIKSSQSSQGIDQKSGNRKFPHLSFS